MTQGTVLDDTGDGSVCCEFVFISDLIIKENYEIKHDGTQCKKDDAQ